MRVTASLTAPALVVGQQYEIVLRLEVGEGWSASEGGMPSAILQIDAPASIDLAGDKLTTYDQLKRNEFLEQPWERLMDANEQRVRFTLLAEPAEGGSVGLNVVAYLADLRAGEGAEAGGDVAGGAGSEGAGDAGALVFVRRRVDLPLVPGARAESAAESRRSC